LPQASTLKNGATSSGPISIAASAAVTEMGGKVAKKLGHGLALFGYPVASDERIGLSPIIHKRTLIGIEFLSRWTLTLPIQVC
jgi:hypothetical protein